MSPVNELAALAAVAGLLSFALTAAAITYARQRALLDHPGQRRSHTMPTPRGGGAGPLLALLSLWGLAGSTGLAWLAPLGGLVWPAVGGLALIAAIGWWDDHSPLTPALRLAVHLAGSIGIVWGLASLQDSVPDTGIPLSMIVMAILVLAFVAAVNVCNFMDGINGLATSQTALCAATVAIGAFARGDGGLAGAFSLVLATCALGFLPFNFPRARIFLGDVGSGFFGAAVALVLTLAWLEQMAHWVLLILLPSAFLVDAGMTLAHRVLSGRRWYRAHREHLYQWMVRTGMTHTRVTLIYACWTALMGVVVLTGPDYPWLWAACGYALAVGVWCRGKRWCLQRARLGVSS